MGKCNHPGGCAGVSSKGRTVCHAHGAKVKRWVRVRLREGPGQDDADEEETRLRSALSKAIVTEKPNVKWEDVAGLDVAKELLKDTIILPRRFPSNFTGKRRPPKGILLYGPPGTGEQLLSSVLRLICRVSFCSYSLQMY